MVEVLIVCITVLVVVGAVLWFGNKFMTNAEAREEAVFQRILAAAKTDIDAVKKDIEAFKELHTSDVNTLTTNQLKLLEQHKAFAATAAMTSPTRGSLFQQAEELMKRRAQPKP